ncbi:alpha/beta hydrolase [Nonomuraea sp. NPDC050783]|uniref:alpha/beta hydrolase n=1 Tax=Nonomuraea sp. NPDC050783 TaxID=3154634 RepID=UPI003467E723
MIHASVPRLPRALLSLFVAASVAVPMSGAARAAAVPAPAPAGVALPREASPRALADRYTASRRDILAAERVAARHGDRWRAASLRAMADPARGFLAFDGRGGGRAVEVVGDLAAARHVAVLVPGADTHLDKYGFLRGGALRLAQALGEPYAVVAWLGYRTPETMSLASLTADRADEGAAALRAFVRWLAAVKGGAGVSLVCHSYGSVVCGRAAPGLDVARLVLLGSPGTGAGDAAGLRTRAAVWAARGDRDWIGWVPHVRLHLPFGTLGLGTDPVSPGFGARVFAAGDAAHSGYLAAGSPALRNVARIVAGRKPVDPVREPGGAGAGTGGTGVLSGAGGVGGRA